MALSDSGDPLAGATDEQAVVEAARLARRTKHERARALLKLITKTRFSGKQLQLDAAGGTPPVGTAHTELGSCMTRPVVSIWDWVRGLSCRR